MVRKTTTTQTQTLSSAASTAVNTFEKLGAAEPWLPLASAASAAIAELRDFASRQIYSDAVVPVGADVRSDFELYTEGWQVIDYAARLAELHAAALTDHAELATFIRGRVARSDLAVAATSRARTLNRPAEELVLEERDAFERTVAGQLHARGQSEPHAEVLAVTVPALDARVAVERERRETLDANAESERREATRSESERQADAELKEAEHLEATRIEERRVEAKAARERGQALAQRIDALKCASLRVGRRPYSCAALAVTARMGVTADFVKSFGFAIDQEELAQRVEAHGSHTLRVGPERDARVFRRDELAQRIRSGASAGFMAGVKIALGREVAA